MNSMVKAAEEKEIIEKQLDLLLENCKKCENQEDLELIKKAFQIARDAHKDMRRKSGDPFIVHPLSVAKIVSSEVGLGTKSVISALLHDVVEDTDYTLDYIKHHFGEEIASIIEGLTKISGVFDKNSNLQVENFKKLLLTLSNDVRVILIKLADRLDNMRTLDSLPRNKQLKIAGETLFLFAPLAHRLGLYAIKTELEDLSLKYQNPKAYEEITKKVEESEKKRQHFINKFSLPIIEKLNEHGIEFDISGRPKSIYSIWNKMLNKKVSFEEIYDLFAIRIIFEPKPGIPEKVQCWNIYSMITDIYMPKPERIRDWVSVPKANGYEALHGTVMGPNGRWVEVQIRTTRMDEIAERGFAAHWKYKDSSSQETKLDKWIERIRQLLENNNSNAAEFIDEFKLNLYSSEILVFTPKGDFISLPKNATVLDFAYEIHTEIGNKAIGAKVNNKLAPLNHRLSSGDQVEILTSDVKRTQREWLDQVNTAKAKSSIKSALKAETKMLVEKGKKDLDNKLKDINLHPNSRILKKLIRGYNVKNKEELYRQIGDGIIDLSNIKKILRKNTKNKWIRYWELSVGRNFPKDIINKNKAPKPAKRNLTNTKSPVVIREGIDEPEKSYRIAKCCNPIPGDEVVGYKSPSEMVIIHKSKCPTAIKLMSSHGNLIVPAKWTTHKILSFLARISVKGIDRIGIVSSLTNVISHDLNANIRKITVESHDGLFEGTIDLYVHDTKHLNNLIMKMFKIKGVVSVNRIEDIEE